VNLKGDAGEGVFQAALNQRDGEVRYVYADPPAAEFLRGVDRGAAAAERVEHHVAGVAARGQDAFKQGDGLLCGIAKPLGCRSAQHLDISPHVADRCTF
jgi:hypothetical protein